jgi:hypothetical protein
MRTKIGYLLVAALAAAGMAYGVTVTNLGRVVTVQLMTDLTPSQQQTDASQYAQRVGQQGVVVATYDLSMGATGAVTLEGGTVPKGAILLEDAVIEVVTPFLPAGTATNVITVGGVTVLASNTNSLQAAGIVAAVATPGMTTSAAKPVVTIGGTATSGVFVVYMPYIQGTAND